MEHKCPTSRPRECPTLANLLFLLAVQAGVAPRRGLSSLWNINGLAQGLVTFPPTGFQGVSYASD